GAACSGVVVWSWGSPGAIGSVAVDSLGSCVGTPVAEPASDGPAVPVVASATATLAATGCAGAEGAGEHAASAAGSSAPASAWARVVSFGKVMGCAVLGEAPILANRGSRPRE